MTDLAQRGRSSGGSESPHVGCMMHKGDDLIAVSSTFVSSDGDGYEIQMGRWSRRLAPLFIDFAGIGGAERILDVGCGTGNLSFSLARNLAVGSVRGIDFSPAYVEHARRQSCDARIDFEVGDACALPFPDASFDHSLSMLVLQFIPQADLAVREMRRVTRSGGTVAAATWDTRGGLASFRMIFDTAAMLDRGGHERRAREYTKPMSRPGDLARAWHVAGLTDVVQDMRTIRMEFTSFADFWAPAEGKEGPAADYVSTLSTEAKAKLRDAIMLAYLDGEDDGARSYAATAWVVKGKTP
jgi:SAM-dependent methyltransferase